jgi:membrane-associated HD superfamily phosphohydrolase
MAYTQDIQDTEIIKEIFRKNRLMFIKDKRSIFTKTRVWSHISFSGFLVLLSVFLFIKKMLKYRMKFISFVLYYHILNIYLIFMFLFVFFCILFIPGHIGLITTYKLSGFRLFILLSIFSYVYLFLTILSIFRVWSNKIPIYFSLFKGITKYIKRLLNIKDCFYNGI